MLTYPIKMMFWKIVKGMQVRARVTVRAVGPASCAKGPGGASLPRVPRSCHAAPGCAAPGPPPRWRAQRPPPRRMGARLRFRHPALIEYFLLKDCAEHLFS